jgi:anti-anti-sigma factor
MFSITQQPDGTIKLVGKMHDAHTQKAQEVLGAVTSSCTIDFSELIYISSSGLGLLLQVQKRLEASGQGLVLTGMSDHVRELFALTRFDLIFDIK